MVKIICCQVVCGRVFRAVLIQLSVAFLPQDEQNLDLQVCGALLVLEHSKQIYSWKPRNPVRHASILTTLAMIGNLIRL